MGFQLSKNSVTIIGAGPAGMLLAWLLVRNGIRVSLVERHEDFSREFRGEGIQASVIKNLEELGLMDDIRALEMGVPAKAARVYFDEQPVVVLKGVEKGADFGFILHQEKFLAYLHQQLSQSPLYTSYLGHTAKSFIEEEGLIVGVETLNKKKEKQVINGDIFMVTTGRGTALRKNLGLKLKKVATHWNILWMLLPRPSDDTLVPKGFKAYLNGDSLFILYSNADGMIQMAWGRKDEAYLRERDFKTRKAALLNQAPKDYRELICKGYTPESKGQYLKVTCDRLEKWYSKNILFLGDAAHTMTPVAGQGINLAMRDSIVAANYLIAGFKSKDMDLTELFQSIQNERIKEVRTMQKFQQKFGYFMLGAQPWKSRLFFFKVLPILSFLGIRKRMLNMVQGGVSQVKFNYNTKKEVVA